MDEREETQDELLAAECFRCREPVAAGEGGWALNPDRPTWAHPEGVPWRVHEECLGGG